MLLEYFKLFIHLIQNKTEKKIAEVINQNALTVAMQIWLQLM